MEQKRPYRSRENRMICGVCGGIADYFNVDRTLIGRLGLVLCKLSLVPNEPGLFA
ncbi:MAG: PspC domain-containing protein [[Clostridium] scindens]